MLYILESSQYLEFMSLRLKDSHYDKLQCHKLQEGYFKYSRKILRTVGSQVPVYVRARWQYRPDPISV